MLYINRINLIVLVHKKMHPSPVLRIAVVRSWVRSTMRTSPSSRRSALLYLFFLHRQHRSCAVFVFGVFCFCFCFCFICFVRQKDIGLFPRRTMGIARQNSHWPVPQKNDKDCSLEERLGLFPRTIGFVRRKNDWLSPREDSLLA